MFIVFSDYGNIMSGYMCLKLYKTKLKVRGRQYMTLRASFHSVPELLYLELEVTSVHPIRWSTITTAASDRFCGVICS